MFKKLILTLVALVTLTQVWADEPFRLHRYSSFQATPVTENTVVFIGNSITNMQVWAEYFDTALPVVNRGNSGGYSYEVLREVQSFITGRPKQAFIMIGTNDITAYEAETIAKNVRQTIKHIQKESPKTEIFLQSCMPSTSGNRGARLLTLNSQLKAVAEEMEVTWIDHYDALKGLVDGTYSTAYDALHPHVVGASIWCRAVLPYVSGATNAILPESPTIYNGGNNSSFGARLSCMAQLPVTSDDILFIGDEIVHSGEWQELLGNANVKNRGTGWGFPGPNLGYIKSSIKPILKGLDANEEPKQIVLNTGYDPMNAASPSLATVEANYEAVINEIRAYAPNAQLTLVGLAPNGNSAYNTNIQTFNLWLETKAASLSNCDYCDIYTTLKSDSRYMSGSYPLGLGYQAIARELAKHIDGCTVMSKEEAEEYFNLIAARKTLSNAIDAIELSFTPGTGVCQYPEATVTKLQAQLDDSYALLAKSDATVDELETAGTTLAAAVEAAKAEVVKPTLSNEEKSVWYTLASKRSESLYMTYDSSKGFCGLTTLSNESYWRFMDHGDGTYDIQNASGRYIVPQSAHNSQISLSMSKPSYGWSLDVCNALGAFNVTAKVGTSTVNCALNQTGNGQNYKIYNWITGMSDDTGCQVVIAEAADFNPDELPDTYNVPFNLMTIGNDGSFTGIEWWYNMKIKNVHYLYYDANNSYLPLNRATLDGTDEEKWAFSGSDQKGYTIYNKKFGTSKVLATPIPSADNGSTYPVLVDADNVPSGYSALWQFAPSTDITNADGYYMAVFGNEAQAVNNYGGNNKLSFWLAGKDAGSTLLFEMAEAIIPVGNKTGDIYKDGAVQTSGWCSTWKSRVTTPFQLSFGTSYNNMNAASTTEAGVGISTGQSQGAWVFSVNNTDYQVSRYEFDIVAGNNDQKITPYGESEIALSTSEATHIEVDVEQTAQFAFSGTNAQATVTNFYVTVKPVYIEPEAQQNLFIYDNNAGTNVCYRIPAIATASDGTIIAVADYRYGGADIGFGRVSLRYRYSEDNGETWGDILTLQESRQGSYGVNQTDDLWAGFGDPCIVADRESSRVLAMSCCGNVSYPAGTWNHHQGIARYRSEDNGRTWTVFGESKYGIECHFEDIAPQIYQKFKDGGVDVQAMFVGSGRIFQSRFTKVGDYYRLYCVVLLRTSGSGGFNYVLYSDDFGDNWNILGGDNFTYGVSGGDEPKAEELPDGSIVLSSRAYGRIFNIFHFTDVEKGLGNWMSQATSNASNSGTIAEGNACNGEIMLVPAKRVEDGQKIWLALQSVPFGPGGRYNVGIYYKALESYDDFINPTNFAKEWDGRHQASYMSSAYSTMTLQKDNSIGFLYEEDTFGRSYTIVYKNYSIEAITDSTYTFDTEGINPFELTSNGIEALTDDLCVSDYVGGLKEEGVADISDAIAAFKAEPNQANYLAIFNAINVAPKVELNPKYQYILRNVGRGTDGNLTLGVNDGLKLGSREYNASDERQMWSFQPTGEEGQYHLYNAATESYIASTLANEVDMYSYTDESKAAPYSLAVINNDCIAVRCMTPTGANFYLHMAGITSRIVAWSASAASQWRFEITDVEAIMPDAIESVVTNGSANASVYDLQGRAVVAPKQGLYIIDRKKVIVK